MLIGEVFAKAGLSAEGYLLRITQYTKAEKIPTVGVEI